MDYRAADRKVWEEIFRNAPDSWRAAAPSPLMYRCASFLREQGVSRVLDIGAGFGRWTNFLSGELQGELAGLDYALGGCRLASRIAADFPGARFVAGDITALPFSDDHFDGFVAVLILDNVAEREGMQAVRELTRVTKSNAAGFVVLNPWPMPESAADSTNPTAGCTRHDYSDDAAMSSLFRGWKVMRSERGEHDLRAFYIRTA